MKFRIPKFICIIALILSFAVFAFPQDLRQQAEEHPLLTVFYLLSTTDKDSRESEKACLSVSFAEVNKVEESKKAAELFEEGGYSEDDLLLIVKNLIDNKRLKEANDFVSYLLKRFENDSYKLEHLWQFLVALQRGDEARKIADSFGDLDKVEAYFLIAAAHLKSKNYQKTLELIEHISPIVEKSKYPKDKAKISLFYAKLGKESQALKFAEESLKVVVWKTGIMEYDHAVIANDIFETYLILGKYDSAFEMLAKQGKSEEPEKMIQVAESYLEKGNLIKTKELFEKSLSQLNPAEYGDSFDLGNLIEIYLKLGELAVAEKLAKNLTGSEYMQQAKLLNIADFYIKKKNRTKASEILNFALEQTKKIDTSEAESGSAWTSEKWDQAKYQAQIIKRFIQMRFDNEALKLISQIQKPYLKASLLTEYVDKNKKRWSAKVLVDYLNEALSLLKREKTDIFDSRRYDVFAITARAFAEIGLPEKSNEVFAESLNILLEEVGTNSGLLFAMCSIGVEFDKAKIKPDENLKQSLRNIIKSWEDDED